MKDKLKKKPKILGIENGVPVVEGADPIDESAEELKARYRKENLNKLLTKNMSDYDKRINEAESEDDAKKIEKRKKLFLKLFSERKQD